MCKFKDCYYNGDNYVGGSYESGLGCGKRDSDLADWFRDYTGEQGYLGKELVRQAYWKIQHFQYPADCPFFEEEE